MSESTPPERAPLPVLDDAALRRWLFRARDALGRHRHRLDALNVYPVPDGDTGTNLYLTLDGGLQGLVDALMERGRAGEALGITAGITALARSSLFAARGNSGVILSQLIAGLAGAVTTRAEADESGVDAPLFVEALEAADRRARRAVANPVEGTILTVIRAAAHAARARLEAGGTALADVVATAHRAARASLEATPTQLEALSRAGVVDAGGAGFVVILDALASVVRGDPPVLAADSGVPDAPAAVHVAAAHGTSPEFEVMCLLDGISEEAAAGLTAALQSVADSVVVAGDARLRTVHAHSREPGAVIEAALDVGRPYGIRIEVLAGDTGNGGQEHPAAGGIDVPRPSRPNAPGAAVGVVAGVQAPRAVPLFEQAGAVVVEDAPGRRVTPAGLVEAARSTGARQVVLLPDDADAIMAAEVARELAAEDGLDLVVLPTRHLVQGLAAVAVFDAGDRACVDRMREAAAGVRVGWVATVTTSADTDAGHCEPGDVLGFVDERARHLGTDLVEVALQVVGSLSCEASELVTIVEGADAAGVGARVAETLSGGTDAEVEVLDGGQSVYELLIGVE